MRTTLTLTNIEESKLKEIAGNLFPSKGIDTLITKEIQRFIRDNGGTEKLCKPSPLLVFKKRRWYRVPENISGAVKIICEQKKITPAEFITRYILVPHLDK